jgi:hypothetical protein
MLTYVLQDVQQQYHAISIRFMVDILLRLVPGCKTVSV